MGRLARWRGVVGLALRRTWTRATRSAPRQVGFTVTGIALPVALLLIVTSVSLGLAASGTVASDDVDYWIVPESGASSAVVSVGGPQFGQVHPVGERLSARPNVEYATPVLLSVLPAEVGGTREFVLAVGVVPPATPIGVAGVSTAGLAAGDPHYADGGYDGPRTDEAVVSRPAASLLGLGRGDSLELTAAGGRNRTLSVANVSSAGTEAGELPVVLVHLSELQTLTGAADGDRADQLLVGTNDPAVRPALEGVYPRSIVLARGGLDAGGVADSSLALAVGLAALAVALTVGVLFAATTLGLAVAAASRERAVLAALGVSGRSRAAMLAVEALAVSLAGGLLGVGLGVAALPVANRLARRYVAEVTVAQFHPALVGYGLAAALAIGLLVLPYLLVMGRRTTSAASLVE